LGRVVVVVNIIIGGSSSSLSDRDEKYKFLQPQKVSLPYFSFGFIPFFPFFLQEEMKTIGYKVSSLTHRRGTKKKLLLLSE
jgi:hypothetical protein